MRDIEKETDFSLLDRHFAEFLAARSGIAAGEGRERFFQLAAQASAALAEGHSCVPLTPSEQELLRGSRLVSEGGNTPLVLHGGRLYLHRYYHYETRLADQIGSLAAVTLGQDGGATLLEHLFPGDPAVVDDQREAARTALAKALTIICGGPGTGKTTTVVKILAILLQAAPNGRPPQIALAAPTGKAAKRLSESVAGSVGRLELPGGIVQAMPAAASTLHRLLGVRRDSPKFRHDREHPLPWDIVVVDEASMVDLALMSKLVDALKPGSRLLLLGDKDQLASVESGAVLGDFISGLPDNTVTLRKTYRFNAHIKALAEAVNRADGDAAWQLLEDRSADNLSVQGGDAAAALVAPYEEYLAQLQQGGADLEKIFAAFNGYRILCAVHHGSRGVETINSRIESALAGRGVLPRTESWYHGRPVLVTRNDYGLGLFNGDIGICLRDPGSGEPQVWFEAADGGMKNFSPHRLPDCETVWAMTVHKSQGSEFDEVAVVLPEEDNRVLSRELLYTAVTRARRRVRLIADRRILGLAAARNTVRHSGLADRLRAARRTKNPAPAPPGSPALSL